MPRPPDPETRPLDYYAWLRAKIGYSHKTAFLAVLAWIVPDSREYWYRARRWAVYRRKRGGK